MISKSKNSTYGIYIHIPFCKGKCPYCDFYSVTCKKGLMEEYHKALIASIKNFCGFGEVIFDKPSNLIVDTVYFGGGTPSVFGEQRISTVINAVKEKFRLLENAEITIECNPSNNLSRLFHEFSKAGGNRVSIGLQSAVNSERIALGRKSTLQQVSSTIDSAKAVGIDNISLDLMLGIPKQTIESLKSSIEFCIEKKVKHISAYMLKLEKNTVFYKQRESLSLPDEDTVCDMYLYLCDILSKNNIHQYEISNFSKKGFESNHNLKYWNSQEYIGFGASAHSFIGGKRFYFTNSIDEYINNKPAIFDEKGGNFKEYAMLKLRLTEGLAEKETMERFGHSIPNSIYEKANSFTDCGLVLCDNMGITFTPKGFLLSNQLIYALLNA